MTPRSTGDDIELGPFFAAGLLLLAYGFRRRRMLLVAAGAGAIWFDQRSETGRALKRRIRRAVEGRAPEPMS